MKKPSLSDLAQMAEVVAAVAVVVSLVYVGKELQRNTASIRAASIDDMSAASAVLLLTVASDSALSRIRQIGDQDPSRLTEAEAYRYHTLMRQVYLTMQNVYFQNELETIDPRVWSVYQRVICTMRSNPGPRSTWSIHRPVLDSAFTALVESCPDA